MNKIVCLVGMTGSGKTEAANFFKEKGFAYVRFGQVVLDEVLKRGVVNEVEERKVRIELRQKFGPGAIAILNLDKFESLIKDFNVVGDGLYSWSEYKILKEKFGDQFICVAVIASPKIRYARLVNRVFDPEKDKKAVNRPLNIKDAQARDYSEIEEAEKGGPIAMADYYIFNEGSKDQFLTDLKTLYGALVATS